jgi:hypothetical protein
VLPSAKVRVAIALEQARALGNLECEGVVLASYLGQSGQPITNPALLVKEAK